LPYADGSWQYRTLSDSESTSSGPGSLCQEHRTRVSDAKPRQLCWLLSADRRPELGMSGKIPAPDTQGKKVTAQNIPACHPCRPLGNKQGVLVPNFRIFTICPPICRFPTGRHQGLRTGTPAGGRHGRPLHLPSHRVTPIKSASRLLTCRHLQKIPSIPDWAKADPTRQSTANVAITSTVSALPSQTRNACSLFHSAIAPHALAALLSPRCTKTGCDPQGSCSPGNSPRCEGPTIPLLRWTQGRACSHATVSPPFGADPLRTIN
jgi:hypothetical protein